MSDCLHRISRHCAEASWPLLDRGILTIGHSGLGSAEFLEKAMAAGSYNDLNEEFRAEYGRVPPNRRDLWQFLRGMFIGDLVLVPSRRDFFSVYEIKGEPHCIADLQLDEDVKTSNGHQITVENGRLLANGDHIDLGFYRRVSPVEKGVSKWDFADSALAARMKTQWTTVDISELRSNLEEALDRHRRGKPLRLYDEAIEPTRGELLEAICRTLTPTKFELLIKWYFKRLGAAVSTPKKRQRGKKGDADVMASFDSLKFTVYIQAKFHHKGTTTGQLGIEQITSYAEWVAASDCNEHTTAKWVISTGVFDEAGEKLARDRGVVLINGEEFAQMLLDAGLEGLEL